MNSLKNKRILVTGATGFIGGRIVERLILEQGAEVVALVHQFKNASRLARFPVRMVGGDVGDRSSLEHAAQGCDAIIHAAMSMGGSGEQNRRANVEGTQNVCEVAKALRARLVHFSTVSVYGNPLGSKLTEDLPKNPVGDDYGLLKLDAERAVQQAQQAGLAATILQPTIVYGPWSMWSSYAINLLKADALALPHGGEGICNAVYVDDVVDAVFLSLTCDQMPSGPFLISGGKATTWREFFQAHLAEDQRGKLISMTEEELADFHLAYNTPPPKAPLLPEQWKSHLKGSIIEIPGFKKFYNSPVGPKALYRKLRGRPPIRPSESRSPNELSGKGPIKKSFLSVEQLLLWESKSVVEIQRARDELGYAPKFHMPAGGEITRIWAHWAFSL
jgi:nucleoside-diphosphate-sugar epimerase